MQIEILGSYRIGNEPWRLIEIQASNVQAPLNFDDFTLPVPGDPYPQAAWDERILSAGEQSGEVRACFFLFVISDEPLQTPAGPLNLPPASERPPHLELVRFEEP